jgi:hypothetical protein
MLVPDVSTLLLLCLGDGIGELLTISYSDTFKSYAVPGKSELRMPKQLFPETK